MNNRQRMYRTNSLIKKYLKSRNFIHIYLFPHLRFSKDYHIENSNFDAMGFKENDTHIYFFQFKTNKKPTDKELQEYKQLESRFNIKCIWITISKKEMIVYNND